jgi:autotransporter-associated beta strand protein
MLEPRVMLAGDSGWGLVNLADSVPEGIRDGQAQWVDYDGNGTIDLLVMGEVNGLATTTLLRNEGDRLVDSGNSLAALREADAVFHDVDGDEDLDLFLCGRSVTGPAASFLYLNDGAGGLEPSRRLLPGVLDATIQQMDIDGDADRDLLVSGWNDAGYVVAFAITCGPLSAPREVAFLGSEVRDEEPIVAALNERGIEILRLDPTDAVSQISAYLKTQEDITGIHLIVHGSAGHFFLGDTRIDTAWIKTHERVLAGWGQGLDSQADLLLYACDTAATEEGRAMLGQLAALTGADGAASIDTTGGVEGDWILEHVVGKVETLPLVVPEYSRTLATRTWTGASSSNWSDAGNWGGVAPGSGDDLVFPALAANRDVLNDLAPGMLVGSITIEGNDYTFGGNSIALSGTVTYAAAAGSADFAMPIQFNAAGDVTVDVANGGTVVFDAALSAQDTEGLTKQGLGTLVLNGLNTYVGPTSVGQGTLSISRDENLGTAPGAPDQTHLDLSGGTLMVTESFELHANRGLQLGLQVVVIYVATGHTLTYRGTTWGNGVEYFFKGGGGTLILAGDNTHRCTTVVLNGVLAVSRDANLGAIPGSPRTGLILDGGTLRATDSFSIHANRGIELFTANNGIEVAASETLTCAGVLDGNGGFTKSGDGTLVLDNDNTYTGSTTIFGGLLVDGSITSDVLISEDASLGGIGTVQGTVTSTDGTLQPGDSPGILSVGETVLDAGSVFAVEVNGPTVGTQYDQLAVTGNVTLGDATLSVLSDTTITPNSVLTVLTATGTVTGSFNNVASGEVIRAVSSNQPFRVTITEDRVQLTALEQPTVAGLRLLASPTSPVSAYATLSPITVQLVDQYGDDVRTAGVNVSASMDQSGLSGTVTATTDANGQAVISQLVIERIGHLRLLFASGQLTPVYSSFFDVIPSVFMNRRRWR